QGLKAIAQRVHGMAKVLTKALEQLGFAQYNKNYFDTIKLQVGDKKHQSKNLSLKAGINFRHTASCMCSRMDETKELDDLKTIISILAEAANKAPEGVLEKALTTADMNFPASLQRKSPYLTHPVFNTHHSEHQMLRYLKSLENKDLSLVH